MIVAPKKENELLKKKLTVRVTADDKAILREIKQREGISYAEVIRQAIYGFYQKDFNK